MAGTALRGSTKAQGRFNVDVSIVLALAGAGLSSGGGSLFGLGFVLLGTTVAAGMVRLGLASLLTVFALLDRTTLGVDVLQWTICVPVRAVFLERCWLAWGRSAAQRRSRHAVKAAR